MPARSRIDALSQYAIPTFTILGYFLTSMKHPEWGILINLLAQPFWLYSSYKAYKDAGQIGLMVTAVLLTITMIIGVVNYWIY